MKLKTLLNLVDSAKPEWKISKPPRSEGGEDGTICQIDRDCIDIWRFGDASGHKRRMKKVMALATYINTSCTMLPEVAEALQGMLEVFFDDKDCEDFETVKKARQVMKKLNSINLCQKP